MPQLSKPIQGLIVLVLAVVVGIGLMSVIGNNDDEGFLGTTNSITSPAPLATEEPDDGSVDAQATPEPSDADGTDEGNTSSAEADDGADSDSDDANTVTTEYKSPLGADANLIFQAFMFIGLLTGASFAVRKDYTTHRNIMTFLIIVNWFSIIGRMRDSMDGIEDTAVNSTLAYVHAGGGSLVMLFATYLAIRMWFENVLPSWIKIEPIKLWMRLTLVVWLGILVLGFLVYFGIYG